jgi:hypothetical protein
MVMLPILLAATLAGDLLLRDTQFIMNQFGKIPCQIVLVDFAIEAV